LQAEDTSTNAFASYSMGPFHQMGTQKRKPKLTRKSQPDRKSLVFYRDKSGKWNITGHSTLQYAIDHCTRVIMNGKATKAMLCHILYEETRKPDQGA